MARRFQYARFGSIDNCISHLSDISLSLAVSRLASEADIAITVVGTFSKEGTDRESLSFAPISGNMCQIVPKNQDEIIPIIAAKVPNIVAMTGPGAVLTPWRDDVPAILYGFYPGEEYGHALIDVLFGYVNPSARLPLTLPNVENEFGFSRAQYPGIAKEGFYSEMMNVDYRWYNTHNISPAFAFGHGLSYTSFEYSNIIVSPNEISVTVKNTGKVRGSEVAQLYLTFPKDAEAPPMQLKGFQKTEVLEAGESQVVIFTLSDNDLSIWRVDTEGSSGWEVVHGTFETYVGASTDDIRIQSSFAI